MFEVAGEEGGSFSPRVNLEPPHYDGIQSLAIRGHELFSGSRDTIIKKWDLDKQELITVRISPIPCVLLSINYRCLGSNLIRT